MVRPFMFIILCLLFLCFLKFKFFLKELQVCYSTRWILRYLEFSWSSHSLFFVNKHDYTINKEWRQEAISFRLQKETDCLRNLDGPVLKKFWFPI